MHDPALVLDWEHRLRSDVDWEIATALGQVAAPALREAMLDSTVGGKRIRPLLTILACVAAGGRIQDALPAAAALELLHASSLVHDDIMDNADLRRGAPAIHKKYGVAMGILAGDALIAAAYRVLQNSPPERMGPILSTFSNCFLALCEGQSADIETPGDVTAESSQHRWMVERKTARLVEACTRIGALAGSGDRHVVDALGRYGFQLGLAYQAVDDVLDATGDEATTGKSVGLDARNGRRTYLTLAYPSADVHAEARLIITHHTAEAMSALDALQPSEARDRLANIALALLRRRS
ncbi:MAG: polyprenyl synthetase family protein [Bacteroidetes bacterium]|nr:polyprenyl synthetase family protein [Bacteroidota bacterium]